jgi:hypothetical protein
MRVALLVLVLVGLAAGADAPTLAATQDLLEPPPRVGVAGLEGCCRSTAEG